MHSCLLIYVFGVYALEKYLSDGCTHCNNLNSYLVKYKYFSENTKTLFDSHFIFNI